MRGVLVIPFLLSLAACGAADEAPATTPAVVVTAVAPTDPTTTTTVAPTTTLPPTTTTTIDPTTEILLRTYEWQEVSEAVRELQNLIGRTPDAVYGPRTRESHLEALRAAGLPEDGVPSPDSGGDSDGDQTAPADTTAPETTAVPETTATPVTVPSYQPNCRVEFLANMSQASAPSFHINLTADGNGTQPPPHTDAIWPAAFDYIITNLNMAEAGAGPSAGVSVVGEVWTSDDAFANGKVVTENLSYDAAPGEEVRFSISVTFWDGGECDAVGTLTVP